MSRSVTPTKSTEKPKATQEDLFSRFDKLAEHHQVNLLARRLVRIGAQYPPTVFHAALDLATAAAVTRTIGECVAAAVNSDPASKETED